MCVKNGPPCKPGKQANPSAFRDYLNAPEEERGKALMRLLTARGSAFPVSWRDRNPGREPDAPHASEEDSPASE